MFDWTDNIHFVAQQLNYYYKDRGGPFSWPWRLCGDIVGVSNSTVRKYCNQEWKMTDTQILRVREIFSSIDFDNHEIKLLTPCNDIITLDMNITDFRREKREIPAKVIPEINKSPIALESRAPTKYNYAWPKSPGLYLLCQIVCPSDKPDEQFYLIKVGKSQNLHQRISSYSGSNPFAKCIDVKVLPPREVDAQEVKCHMMMAKKWHRQGSTEWFVLPKEDYMKILKEGFAALRF